MTSRDPVGHTALAPGDDCKQPTLLHADAFTRRAAIAAVSLLFVGWRSPGRAYPPSNTEKLEVMSDPRVKTYETYLSAWSAIPDDDRARLLRETLSEDIVFTNPLRTRRGLADVALHLQGFQQRSPGGSFRMNEMLGWENMGLRRGSSSMFRANRGSGAMTCWPMMDRAAWRVFSSLAI